MADIGDVGSPGHRLRLLLDHSRVPAVVTRLSDETILFVNRAMLRTGGWKADDILGKRADDIKLWGDRDKHAAVIEHLREHGFAYEMPERLRDGDGCAIDAVTSAEVIEFDDECCVLALFNKASDGPRAHEEMRHYRLVLEAATTDTRKEILSQGRINELVQVGGNEWLTEFVALCLQDISANVDKLITAMKNGDASVVRNMAHTLAGTTATLGATRFPSLCQQVEDEAGGAPVGRPIKPEDVESALTALKEAWKEELARRSES